MHASAGVAREGSTRASPHFAGLQLLVDRLRFRVGAAGREDGSGSVGVHRLPWWPVASRAP
jgi:hypothetical protein